MNIMLAVAAICAVLWLEYTKGIIVYKRKIAVAFIGRTKSSCAEFSFTACTGVVKFGRMLAEGRYEFVSDISLTDGEARIEILKGRQAVAVLTPQNKTAVLDLPKGRYTILTRYRKADGSLKVEWKQI